MDILYLVGPNSINGYQDLRYSLRSISQHGKNIDRVFVCGHCPEFLSDYVIKVNYLPDQSLPKTKKIFSQLLYAVKNTDIGVNHNGEFLISMDDHIYVKEVDFNQYPVYVKDYIHRGYRYLLPDHLDYTKGSVEYQQILVNTYHFCINAGLNILNFVPHRNMHMNRYVFAEMESSGLINEYFNNPQEIEGLIVAQNYRLRTHPFTYSICMDIKSDSPGKLKYYINSNQQVHCFSMNDFTLGSELDTFIGGLFPNKCLYENELECAVVCVGSDVSDGISS